MGYKIGQRSAGEIRPPSGGGSGRKDPVVIVVKVEKSEG